MRFSSPSSRTSSSSWFASGPARRALALCSLAVPQAPAALDHRACDNILEESELGGVKVFIRVSIDCIGGRAGLAMQTRVGALDPRLSAVEGLGKECTGMSSVS